MTVRSKFGERLVKKGWWVNMILSDGQDDCKIKMVKVSTRADNIDETIMISTFDTISK